MPRRAIAASRLSYVGKWYRGAPCVTPAARVRRGEVRAGGSRAGVLDGAGSLAGVVRPGRHPARYDRAESVRERPAVRKPGVRFDNRCAEQPCIARRALGLRRTLGT